MTITSGIRLGTQAATTRGFGLNEFKKVGDLITKVVEGLSKSPQDNSKIEKEVKKEVVALCSKFPIYNHLVENKLCFVHSVEKKIPQSLTQGPLKMAQLLEEEEFADAKEKNVLLLLKEFSLEN